MLQRVHVARVTTQDATSFGSDLPAGSPAATGRARAIPATRWRLRHNATRRRDERDAIFDANCVHHQVRTMCPRVAVATNPTRPTPEPRAGGFIHPPVRGLRPLARSSSRAIDEDEGLTIFFAIHRSATVRSTARRSRTARYDRASAIRSHKYLSRQVLREHSIGTWRADGDDGAIGKSERGSLYLVLSLSF